jgi:hypothetical protein
MECLIMDDMNTFIYTRHLRNIYFVALEVVIAVYGFRRAGQSRDRVRNCFELLIAEIAVGQ